MADKPIGKITHYYDKLGVAVINLSAALAAGDKIKLVGHGNEFTQEVDSMQVEHEKVEKAKKSGFNTYVAEKLGLEVEYPSNWSEVMENCSSEGESICFNSGHDQDWVAVIVMHDQPYKDVKENMIRMEN